MRAIDTNASCATGYCSACSPKLLALRIPAANSLQKQLFNTELPGDVQVIVNKRIASG